MIAKIQVPHMERYLNVGMFLGMFSLNLYQHHSHHSSTSMGMKICVYKLIGEVLFLILTNSVKHTLWDFFKFHLPQDKGQNFHIFERQTSTQKVRNQHD